MASKDKPHVTVSTSSGGSLGFRPRTKIIIIVAACVLVLGGLGWYLIARHNADKSKDTANAATQQSLQASLQAALAGASNPSAIVDAAGRLIAGVNNKTFKMKNTEVAQLYLQRASAYMNLKQYKNAVPGYDTAAKLDDKNKAAALQGEIEARYHLGDRTQLVPLYQQLIVQTKKQTDNPFASSFITQYQASITSLQKGQGLPAYDN